ncbi:MAG TPA: AAA family ATPase, partial [Pilimelia sp.]|nr:AAA family ATPase [Pilimelia sp.]
MAYRAADVPLVGRADELRAFAATLDRVPQEGVGAVFLTGESGMGKTRLLTAAADAARQAGMPVFWGTCLDLGDASPLHPVRQALHSFDPPPGPAGALAAAAARDALALLDHGTTEAEGSGGLLERLCRHLGAAAGGRPFVLVLDDLQWADQTTRRLLLYLLAGLADLRLVLFGAAATDKPQDGVALRQTLLQLRKIRTVRVLDLPPLGRADADRLAAEVAGQPLEPGAADLVWQRSGGNPSVIGELVRYAGAAGGGIPASLREVVLTRLAALGPDCQAAVRAVAAGVEPVNHTLLAQVVTLEEDRLIEAVREAVAGHVLTVVGDGYRLHSQLIKDVVEPTLLPTERASLHRRYAEALSAAPGGNSRHDWLAMHWRRAGDRDRALTAAVAAAREAERLYGFAEAHEHWSAALELADAGAAGGPDRVALARRAAAAAHCCGEYDRALELLDAVDPGGGDTPLWLLTLRAGYLADAGRTGEAEAVYERALRHPAAEGAAAIAACSAELLRRLGRYHEAQLRARDALARARAADDVSAMVAAGAALGFSQAYLTDPDAGLDTLQETLHTAERAGSPEDIGRAYQYLAELLTGPLNALEAGVDTARAGAERVSALGLGRTYGAQLAAVAGAGLFRLGRWAEAAALIDEALRRRPSGADAAELLMARCRISIGTGDVAAAERDLDSLCALLADGSPPQWVVMLTLQASVAIWSGRYEEARAAVRRGLEIAERSREEVWLLGPLVWHGLWAEAEERAGGAGRHDEENVAHLRRVLDRIVAASAGAAAPVRASVQTYRDWCAAEATRLTGESDAAAWARAAAGWERQQHPYPAAYCRLRQAEAMFAQRTRNAAAAAVLRDADVRTRRLGARLLAAEVRALAARARVALAPAAHPPAAPAAPAPAARPAPAPAE